MHILLVDDDKSMLMTLRHLLESDHHVSSASTLSGAYQRLAETDIDLVLLDIMLPDGCGIDGLHHIKQHHPDIDVVMITAVREIARAVEAIKGGAFDYLTKDFCAEEIAALAARVDEKRGQARAIASLRSEVETLRRHPMFLGDAPASRALAQLLDKVGPLPSTLLIQGESGTGKELFARTVFERFSQPDKPFVTVDIAALPDNLVESTLFGHEKGAFTGATQRHIGKFELADGGTLFLDEIGEVPIGAQVKLLRFLQEGEFERVGGNHAIKLRARLLAATNRDLQAMVERGTFREDLYYRLNVIPLTLPPLRNRCEDIPALTTLFIERFRRRFGRQAITLDKDAIAVLKRYRWPGNIRELEHLIERLVATVDGDCIGVADLPMEMTLQPIQAADVRAVESEVAANADYLRSATEMFERQLIQKALHRCAGNKKRTAEDLGIPLSTLKFKISKLGIDNHRRKQDGENRPTDA